MGTTRKLPGTYSAVLFFVMTYPSSRLPGVEPLMCENPSRRSCDEIKSRNPVGLNSWKLLMSYEHEAPPGVVDAIRVIQWGNDCQVQSVNVMWR